MQPTGPPYYDPRDPQGQLPPLRYSTGFSDYTGQAPSWTAQAAAPPPPPPPPPAPLLRLVNPYAPAFPPYYHSAYPSPSYASQQNNRLAPPGGSLARLDHNQQPSPALSRSPQLPPSYPSRSGSATSTASQARTSSTDSSQHHARDDSSRPDSPPTNLQLSALRYWKPKIDAMSGTDLAHRAQAEADLAHMTVDKLKLAIRNTNQHLSLHMRVSGKKNDLYSALANQLAFEFGKPDKSRFQTMRAAISAAKINSTNLAPVGGYYNANAGYGNYGASTSTAAAVNAYGAAAYGGAAHGYGAPAPGAAGAAAAARAGASTSAAAAATNNLPAPRFGGAGAYGTGAAAAAAVNGYGRVADDIPIRFRPSPFFRVDKFVSPVVSMPKAAQGDRKTVVCPITLTEAQRALLVKSKESPANPQYQVRLYCTSDTNYNQLRSHVNQFPAPVEYPGVCEIKINGVTIVANTKGIKKQPGTAPPVNLSPKQGTAIALTPGVPNRAEVHYINTDKVFYLIAYLVEYTPVDKVVNRVKAGKTKSKEEVIQSIIAINSDEDVDASALGVSLRDPLAYTRIEIPIRSAHCEHIACFDATTWFEVNEQTPQWQCPICSKTLKVDDIVVDGYFEDILKVCSSAVDAVTVEPDGTWRSDNDKYGTAKPRSSLASANASGRNTPVGNGVGGGRETPGSGGGGGGGAGGGASDKGKQRAEGELVLLSDDESDDSDAPLAKRRRVDWGGPGAGGGTASAGTGGSSTPLGGGGGGARRREVVDLTLSSDDEDDGGRPAAARPTSTATAAATTRLPPPPMERQTSDRKTAAEVDRDIQDMSDRMVRDYGPDWKRQFGY
ncbi:hypothetical protein JCM8208_001582 [Rhodotorula glutinis]